MDRPLLLSVLSKYRYGTAADSPPLVLITNQLLTFLDLKGDIVPSHHMPPNSSPQQADSSFSVISPIIVSSQASPTHVR